MHLRARSAGAIVLALALVGAAGGPPWLRPPPGWVVVEKPPSYGALRILAMWKSPTTSSLSQNLSLGVQPFGGSVESFAVATERALKSAPIKPTRYHDEPLACASGPARLLVYDTRAYGIAGHFEQIAVKRGGDVYVATYTRDVDQPENGPAVAALRAICR